MNTNLKLGIVGVASAALFLGAGLAYRSSAGGESLITFVAFGLSALAAVALEAQVIREKGLLSLLVLGNAAAFALSAAPSFSLPMLLAAALFYAAFLAAAFRGRVLSSGLMAPAPARVGRSMLPLMFTGFAVFAAILYTSSFATGDLAFSESAFRNLVGPSETALSGLIPGFSFDMSFRAAVRAAVESRLPPELSALPEAARRELLNQSEGQVFGTLSEFLQTRISPQESVQSGLRRALNLRLSAVPENFKTPMRAGFGVLVFLTIKGFGFLFTFPVALLVWLLYKGLLAIGFLTVTTEDIQKESLSI